MRADAKMGQEGGTGLPDGERLAAAAETFQLLGDPTRLRILWTLLRRECSVNELADLVEAQPAAVSQHLAKLRLARLVRPRRDGAHMFYMTENSHVARLLTECLRHADHISEGRSEGVHTKSLGPNGPSSMMGAPANRR